MIYPFGKAPGHLPMAAMRAADELGVAVRNSNDLDLKPIHWLTMEVEDNIGTLALFSRVEHVLRALAAWRQEGDVDRVIASCKEHGRVLICPSCRAAEIGRLGGAKVTPKRLRQLKKAAKRKRPGARKVNRAAKKEVAS